MNSIAKYTALAFAGVALMGVAGASALAEEGENKGRQYKKARIMRSEVVDKNVETITNGVVITLTTTDEAALEKLQSMAERMQERGGEGKEDMSVSVETITNGVVITKTSTDAEKVEKMHERVAKYEMKQSVTRTTENIENGVKITLTSDNAEAVEVLQNREMKTPRGNQNIEVTKENISNGVVITMTSDDAEIVEKIQERADEPHTHRRRGRGGQRGGGQR